MFILATIILCVYGGGGRLGQSPESGQLTDSRVGWGGIVGLGRMGWGRDPNQTSPDFRFLEVGISVTVCILRLFCRRFLPKLHFSLF